MIKTPELNILQTLMKANPPHEANQVLADKLMEDGWMDKGYDLSDEATKNRFGYAGYDHGPVVTNDENRPEEDINELVYNIRQQDQERMRQRGEPFYPDRPFSGPHAGSGPKPDDDIRRMRGSHQSSFDPDDYSDPIDRKFAPDFNLDRGNHWSTRNPHLSADSEFWHRINANSEPDSVPSQNEADRVENLPPGTEFSATKAKETWAKVKKAEDLNIWLATHALKKMAVDPAKLGVIHSASDFQGGENLVDDRNETIAHPGHEEHSVSAFRNLILNAPHLVKPRINKRPKKDERLSDDDMVLQDGITKKLVYNIDSIPGMDGSQNFMVKPYHERVINRVKDWMRWPIQGWAEMTNQTLYHAAGMGDSHQRVHVSTIPHMNNKTGEVLDYPALVIHLDKGYVPKMDTDMYQRQATRDKSKEEVHKIALMDFLTGNEDRHALNLLINPMTAKPLAIDHSRSFQYYKSGKANRTTHFNQYANRAGLMNLIEAPTGHPGSKPVDDYHEFLNDRIFGSWWKTYGSAIDGALKKRLDNIKDKNLREHIYRNFKNRANFLDDLARHGVESFGDWQEHPVNIYKYKEKGSRDNELYPEDW